MKRTYICLVLCLCAAIPLLLSGCSGSSDDFGPEPENAPAVREALAVQTTIAPEPSDAASSCSQALVALIDNPPETKAELAEALADWSARAQAHPNGAACQLGLSLVMFAAALDNVAEVAGADLFPPDVEPVSVAFLMSLPSSTKMGGLVGVYRGFYEKLSSGVGTEQIPDDTEITSERMREAIRRYLLPVLYTDSGSIYNRLAPFADSNVTEALVTLNSVASDSVGTLDDGGDIVRMYTCDFNLIVSGVVGLYGAVLEAMAYQWPELDELSLPGDIVSLDANGDNLLTPNEYFPPRPFAILDPAYGLAYMRGSYDAYVEAVNRALTSTRTIPSDDTDLLNMLYSDMGWVGTTALPETPFDTFVLILEHFDALLDGPQSLTIEYWSEGQSHSQTSLVVDLRQIFIDPVRDIRDIFPNAHIVWEVQRDGAVQPTVTAPSYDIEVSLLDFPDLTFNGVLPNFPTVAVTVALHDYFIVVHPGFPEEPIEIGDIGDSLFSDFRR